VFSWQRFARVVIAKSAAYPWAAGKAGRSKHHPDLWQLLVSPLSHGKQFERSRSNGTLAWFSACQDSALIIFPARPPSRSALRWFTCISSPPPAPTYWPTFIFLQSGPSGAPLARCVTLFAPAKFTRWGVV